MDTSEITSELTRLCQRCPLGNPRGNCPLAALRRLPLARQIRLLHKLSPEQQATIWRSHQGCPLMLAHAAAHEQLLSIAL